MARQSIEEHIEKTFIKLMESRPVDEIDVQLLCKSVDISRQVFYYHYKNIYDVVLAIYAKEQLEINLEDDEHDIIERFINLLFRNEKMNRDIVNSSCEEVIRNLGFSFIYGAFAAFYEKNGINVDDRLEISLLLASALSQEILRLFKDETYSKKDIQDKLFKYLDYRFFQDILLKYK